MITQTQRGCRAASGWQAGILLAWFAALPLTAMDIQLPLLKSGTEVFTNVTVYEQTQTDLFIKHARGFGNVKISSLDVATLRLLKLGGGASEEETANTVSGKAAATVANVKERLAGLEWKTPSQSEVLGLLERVRPNPNLLIGILAVALGLYMLFAACLKLICQNAGSKSGWMVWIPLLQLFPLLRAAKMSAWWFVAFMIPPINLVAHCVWSVKISRACGKGGWVALLLILPGTNLLTLLYLALLPRGNQPAKSDAPLPRHSMVLGGA